MNSDQTSSVEAQDDSQSLSKAFATLANAVKETKETGKTSVPDHLLRLNYLRIHERVRNGLRKLANCRCPSDGSCGCKDPFNVDDLAGLFMLKLLKLRDINSLQSPKVLRKMIVWVWNDAQKKANRSKRNSGTENLSLDEISDVVAIETKDELTQDKEQFLAILESLVIKKKIKAKEAVVIRCYVFEDKEPNEIAVEHDISNSTVTRYLKKVALIQKRWR